MRLRLTLAATSAVLALSSVAAAQQPWLQDRRYGEGVGIRSGNFEFHPGIAAEFGYDSNYFQRSGTDTGPNGSDQPVEDAWRLRITPSLTFSTLSERRLGQQAVVRQQDFVMSGRLFASYNELFGSEAVSDQRHVDAGVGARVDISPQRQFGGDIYGDFVRQGEPSNLDNPEAAFDRGTVRGGAGVSWRPGGGLFDWRVGYEAAYNYFEDDPFGGLDNLQHNILTRGRWRFLPRSALLYDARYTMVRYLNDGPQPDGDFVEARFGFSGLVTTRLAILGLLGWNSSFYEAQGSTTPAQDYDGYVAQAEVKYFLAAGGSVDSAEVGISSIAAGFIRSFSNSYLGSFYVRDRGYMNLSYFLGGVFVASLEGGFSRYSYPRFGPAPEQGSFEQSRIDARLFGEYRFSDIVGLNTTLLYDQAMGPDDPIPVGIDDPATAADETQNDDLEYKRFQAYIGMRVFW
jgi:hypothetical protein